MVRTCFPLAFSFLLLSLAGCGCQTGYTTPDGGDGPGNDWHYHLAFGPDFLGYDHVLGAWDDTLDRVLYFARGPDQYYDLYITNFAKTQTICVTCDKPFLPNRHMGTPSFLPGGEFILFTAEREVHEGGYCHEPWCGSYAALPGYGAYNDVWLIRSDGTQAWQLTHHSAADVTAIILPAASSDGTRLVWSKHLDGLNPFATDWRFWGRWPLETAELAWTGGSFGVGTPTVANVRTYEPRLGLNEANSFTLDNERFFFTSSNPAAPLDTQLFSVDFATLTDLRQLTDNGEFNEHPNLMPNGEQVLFMSGRQSSNDSEIWIMNTDGSHQQRLSYLNEPWHPAWNGGPKLTGGTLAAASDTGYPARVMNLQLAGPLEYRALIKSGVITRRPAARGTGLKGEYYADGNFGTLALTRVDPQLNFYWKDGVAGRDAPSPSPGIVPADGFSVRWSGYIEAFSDSGGTYSFRCVYDDQCRVWVDGQQIINAWLFWPGVVDGTVTLAPGSRHALRVEVIEGAGDAQLRLAWKGPDFDWEVVPASQLFPAP
ncbi:MAG: PA14 domain-containing protein [Myxococcaceae bacterium]